MVQWLRIWEAGTNLQGQLHEVQQDPGSGRVYRVCGTRAGQEYVSQWCRCVVPRSAWVNWGFTPDDPNWVDETRSVGGDEELDLNREGK